MPLASARTATRLRTRRRASWGKDLIVERGVSCAASALHVTGQIDAFVSWPPPPPYSVIVVAFVLASKRKIETRRPRRCCVCVHLHWNHNRPWRGRGGASGVRRRRIGPRPIESCHLRCTAHALHCHSLHRRRHAHRGCRHTPSRLCALVEPR